MTEGNTSNVIVQNAWRRHDRRWQDNRYVYAVLSRRSGGVSVGLNLNPDKACNFDCIYCQVDRRIPPAVRKVDLRLLELELDRVLEAHRDGSLYKIPPLDRIPPEMREIRDLAFSGDGEPTTYPGFEEAVRITARARLHFGLDAAKLVLITNAACLARPSVRRALALMDENNGEIWAKLDAGTDEYFRLINRTNRPLGKILDNILDAARVRPVVIQSLWLRLRGEPPPASEVETYCDRINRLLRDGGRLKAIQTTTIARNPAESWVAPLSDAELDAIAARVRSRVPVPVETYYGVRP